MSLSTPLRAAALAVLGLSACTGAIAGRDGKPDPGDTDPGGGSGMGNSGNRSGSGGNGSGGSTGGGAPGVEAPGRTALRRLTHLEYNNTVRDLLGLRDDFAGTFADDEDAGGFAANTVSPVSEALADQYHAAADTVASKAVAAGVNKIAPCPATSPPDACAQDFVRSFGRRAFRRPLTPDEVARYKQVYTAGASGADFAGGVGLVITAML